MILELLRQRFSVRNFKDEPIPDTILQEMLEAGRLAPSGGNEQPWKFVVVTEKILIKDLAELAGRQKWIARSPLIIILCSQKVQDDNGGRAIQSQRFPELEEALTSMDRELYSALNSEEHQTKIPATLMALVALEHGVGCTWVSRFKVKEVGALLGVPEDYLSSEILVFGYPCGEACLVGKKPQDEVVIYRTG